ncbi:MAG TPA: hypothetical protein PL195_02375 [bacterium]|nr:hypothetical protein [bacterium]
MKMKAIIFSMLILQIFFLVSCGENEKEKDENTEDKESEIDEEIGDEIGEEIDEVPDEESEKLIEFTTHSIYYAHDGKTNVNQQVINSWEDVKAIAEHIEEYTSESDFDFEKNLVIVVTLEGSPSCHKLFAKKVTDEGKGFAIHINSVKPSSDCSCDAAVYSHILFVNIEKDIISDIFGESYEIDYKINVETRCLTDEETSDW